MRQFEKYTGSHFDSYEEYKENYKVNAPADFNFAYDVMDVLASEQPDKLALLWTNVAGEEKEFTYKDLMEASNKTANYFASLGVKKGDMVMLILKRRHEFWASMLALHKLGAVAIPATHLLTAKDIIYRCNYAEVKLLVTVAGENVVEQVEQAMPELTTLKHKVLVGEVRPGWEDYNAGVAAASTKFARPVGAQATVVEDPMLLFFTSGTTGMPKMVLHNFGYALAHIQTAVFWHDARPDGVHLTVSDSGWGKCLWGKFYGQWLAETIVFVYDFDKFVPNEMLDIISKYQITTFCAPPTIYRYFIKEDLSKYDLSCLKYVTTAGEALNPEVFSQFKEAVGLEIKEAFGQTETTVMLGNYVCMQSKVGSLGKPSPQYNVDIVDEEGNSTKPGEVGEIVIRVDKENMPIGLFMCYYKDDAEMARAWKQGMYHTGDTAWKDEEGFYWYVGRVDDVIKSSGYRIGPFEVESALMEHPAVLETAITGVPHPDRGQIIKATIVLAQGYTPSDELKKELQDHVKRTTAPYKYPREIEFVEELPKTISGKIKRFVLRGENR